jgi:tetratricopeptide (TPR) repeat protein
MQPWEKQRACFEIFTMRVPFTKPSILLISVLLLSCSSLAAQKPKDINPPAKKTVTMEDAKVYQEAMVWFKKAEAMIGTPEENSDAQMELFLKATRIMPDFLEAHYNLGLIYANRNRAKDAAQEFEKVLKLEPKFDPGIYFLLASAYQESGEIGGAMTALREGLKRKPGDSRMLRALAYLQFNQKQDEGAIRTLLQLLEIEPADVSSRVELAQLYQRNDQLDSAIGSYQDAVKMEPSNFVARFNLGLIYLRQRKYPEAIAQLEAANQSKPGNAELQERLGDAYSFQRQYAKAATAYRAALAKTAERASIYGKLGFTLANLNQTEDAVGVLEQAARLNPRNPDTYYLLGDLYSDLKRPDAAIEAYKRSLEINPNLKEVHYNLGTLYAEQKRLPDAATELRIAVKLDDDYAAAWSNLALVAEKLELDQEAIQAHEKVISLGKGKGNDYFRLGVLYAKANQPEQAIASFGKAIELEPDKYRGILLEELKNVHSVLDSIRYKEGFTRLLNLPSK